MMTFVRSLVGVALAAAVIYAPAVIAGTHTWTGAVNGNWSVAGNWSEGAAPAMGESNLRLVFPIGASRLSTTNNIGPLTLETLSISGNNYILYGGSALTFTEVIGNSLTCSGSANVLYAPLILNGTIEIAVGAGDSLYLRNVVQGSGNLTKYGDGTLVFQATGANTFSGGLLVYDGVLELQGNAVSVPGPVTIGDPAAASAFPVLRLANNDQIADGASVTIHVNGDLECFGFEDVVGALHLIGGRVRLQTGFLGLNGAVNASGAAAFVGPGWVNLNSATRAFNVTNGTCQVGANLSNGTVASGGLVKNGAGTLALSASNSFNGAVTIAAGTLLLQHENGLGTTAANTAVSAGATLRVTGNPTAFLGRETLGLGGTFEVAGPNINWTGNIAIGDDASVVVPGAQTLICSNIISGISGSLTKRGTGTLILKGGSANSFLGPILAEEGVVQLAKPAGLAAVRGGLTIGNTNGVAASVELLAANQIHDSAALFVDESGELDLGSFAEGVGPITMRGGSIAGTSGLLTLNGDITALSNFEGSAITAPLSLGAAERTITVHFGGALLCNKSISGGAGIGFVKEGPGWMYLSGAGNTYSGVTRIRSGTLRLSGSAVPGSTAAGTIVEAGGELYLVGTTIGNESLALNGFGTFGWGALIFASTNSWSGPVILASDTGVYGDNPLQVIPPRLTLSGSVSGAGRLSVDMPDLYVLEFSGAADNLNNGDTIVRNGTVELNKTAGFTAIAGTLLIGATNSVYNTAFVRLRHNNQIANSASLHVLPGGLLDLNGFVDTVGPLHLTAGEVETGAGTLTLNGDITAHDFIVVDGIITGHAPSLISGKLSLGGATRTVLANGDPSNDLEITATVSDGGAASGIIKLGPGGLALESGNSFSGAMLIQEGVVFVTHGGALGTSSAGTIVAPGASLILQSGAGEMMVAGEPLELSGHGRNGIGALYSPSGTNRWLGPVMLAMDASIGIATPNALIDLGGALAGAKDLSKIGDGILLFSGTNANTLSGATFVKSGQLLLAKTNAVAMAGPLLIGQTNGVPQSVVVRHLRDHQIADNAPVTVNYSGLLDLNDRFDGIGALTLNSSVVDTGFGQVNVFGDISEISSNGFSRITGAIALGGAHRAISVPSFFTALELDAQVSDGGNAGGFTKTGSGSVTLSRFNDYSGVTVVNEGSLWLAHNHALGSGAAGTVLAGLYASLYLPNLVKIEEESLTVSNGCHLYAYGTNAWNGPIFLASSNHSLGAWTVDANARLTLGGAISGVGGMFYGGRGTTTLQGTNSNTYARQSYVWGGTLLLAKTNAVALAGTIEIGNGYYLDPDPAIVRCLQPDQFADDADITVLHGISTYVAGTLDLNECSDVIGALWGNGDIALGAGQLTVGSNNRNSGFHGRISGTGPTSLVKSGTGTFELSGTNTLSGATLVNGGVLLVNGSLSNSAVTVAASASMGGTGVVKSLTASGGVRPGPLVLAESYGRLTSLGSLHLAPGSHYYCELGGMMAGTNCDQLRASGSVALNSVILNLSEHFPASVSNQFTIIDIPIGGVAMGNFAGLPEGTVFSASAGRTFQITYQGGDGNDVVLTQITVPQAAEVSGITKSPLGPMQINGTGTPGLGYDVYASTNLASTNWLNIGTVTADEEGRLQFIDQDSMVLPMRFYRFVLP